MKWFLLLAVNLLGGFIVIKMPDMSDHVVGFMVTALGNYFIGTGEGEE